MERAMAELIRLGGERAEFIVVASVLQKDLRPLVTWKRVRVPQSPASLRFVLFWLIAGVRLSRLRPDVVHTLGAITWRRADVVTIAFCHAAFVEVDAERESGVSMARRLNRVVHRALAVAAERFCYQSERTRLFAAVSPGVQRELASHYPAIPAAVTPNGVDSERFRPDPVAGAALRAENGVQPADVVAILVGGDWHRKGLAIAIEALALARRQGLEQVRLWIVGEGDRARFEAVAREHGVLAQVLFLGRRSDAERYLQASDIFVFPTSYETFSIASYEAAATGLPLIATAVSGIEDLIGDDEAGLSTPATAEAVAARLVRLAADPELRRRLGNIGRQRALQFSWQRSASSVLEAYEHVLNDAAAPTS